MKQVNRVGSLETQIREVIYLVCVLVKVTRGLFWSTGIESKTLCFTSVHIITWLDTKSRVLGTKVFWHALKDMLNSDTPKRQTLFATARDFSLWISSLNCDEETHVTCPFLHHVSVWQWTRFPGIVKKYFFGHLAFLKGVLNQLIFLN